VPEPRHFKARLGARLLRPHHVQVLLEGDAQRPRLLIAKLKQRQHFFPSSYKLRRVRGAARVGLDPAAEVPILNVSTVPQGQ